MAFRWLIVTAFILFVVNLAETMKIGFSNPVVKTVFILACCAFMVGRKKNYVILTLFALNMLMVFVLGAMTDYPEFHWSLLVGGLNQIVVIYMLLAAEPTEKDRDALLIVGAWLPVICAVLGLCFQVVGLRSAFPQEFNTGGSRFAGTLNPAFLGGLAMCGIFASLKLTDFGRPRYYALIPVQLLIMILSGARVALAVCMSVSFSAFYSSKQRSLRMKIWGTIGGLALAIVIAPLAYIKYAARLESSGLSGRDVMWPWLLSMSEQYPDYGIGFAHQYWATPRAVFILFSSNAAHNDYLRLLVELGWFGVFAFYIMLTMAILIVWTSKRVKRDPIVMQAYLGFLLFSITDNALATPCYFLIILLAVFSASGRPATATPEYDKLRQAPPRRRFGRTPLLPQPALPGGAPAFARPD